MTGRSLIRHVETHWRGLGLAATIGACAGFLADHYGAPAMLFALLIGIAFHFLHDQPQCAPGIDLASKTVLRLGVALLGFRLHVEDIISMGAGVVLTVCLLLAFTIGAGLVLAPVFGRPRTFGVLTGGAVAICGASAALALAAVLPKSKTLERDTLFTVIAVTTLSTIAMIGYPILFQVLGLGDAEIGFLIGATIHDVAQVVGAGYSVSEVAGNTAALVKLERVALLPVVLLAVSFMSRGGEAKGISLPWFVIAFAVFVAINSTGIVPLEVEALINTVSRAFLVVAIAALGVKTSLAAMFQLGGGHIGLIVTETLLLLAAAVTVVLIWF
ncbi:putative sulfate exporter family transporter [Acuticoccus sp. M5D2P5]|uniref:YeiH family protein n=1 Tax=Acuticoccus kalidii TaxID=2910977 RepID=UPI001F22AF84|nr:putative sulfate exporter family transporter [Acuticoccus kalidii]MCF3933214.1 putative sulfate exporter family transporter [Acuticoccus kalidii]